MIQMNTNKWDIYGGFDMAHCVSGTLGLGMHGNFIIVKLFVFDSGSVD